MTNTQKQKQNRARKFKRNIERMLTSTATVAETGASWYLKAKASCETIAQAHNVPVSIVTGVVAALSPNNQWERNLSNADQMISNFIAGEPIERCKPSTYKAMRDKAWTILKTGSASDDDILRQLRGQKIMSFYRCIMGENDCVIDGHAYNIARNERVELTNNKTNISKNLYVELQNAYIAIAKKHGMQAHELQAITWEKWRKTHGIT